MPSIESEHLSGFVRVSMKPFHRFRRVSDIVELRLNPETKEIVAVFDDGEQAPLFNEIVRDHNSVFHLLDDIRNDCRIPYHRMKPENFPSLPREEFLKLSREEQFRRLPLKGEAPE